MKDQPEALRVADALHLRPDCNVRSDAARLLREQHAEIERLRKMLEQNKACNPHPKAPHGFSRNASHTEDRYVCECESWDPWEAGYQQGVTDTFLDYGVES